MNILLLVFPLVLALGGEKIETPHKVLRFECNDCHSSTTWREVKFDHAKTDFALEDRHTKVKCVQCHSLEDFRVAGSDCVSCHDDIHQGKLAHTCEQCHSARGWSVFNTLKVHANTSFPLIGAHARLDCRACHISEIEGEYSFLKSECIFCHKTDFEQAQSPPHTQMGLGTRCEDCHFMVSWQPANFSGHDSFFPIFSGRHAGVWTSCEICHASSQDYTIFDCFNCHEHSKVRMDGAHSDIRNYVYESGACYSCHPGGSAGG